jgi:hypothetical protein
MISRFDFKFTSKSELIAWIILMLFVQICFGQKNMGVSDQESFTKLTDETMKREIASFSMKGSSILKTDSLAKKKLEGLPLKKCSDKFAFFEKGNIYDSELIVNIESETEKPVTVIRLLYGRYGQYFLPDSAIADIYNPKFCEQYTKKGKPIKSSCKVFQSEDKRRIYIYMLNGEGVNRYEVTWVIQDGKYHTRVIDPV